MNQPDQVASRDPAVKAAPLVLCALLMEASFLAIHAARDQAQQVALTLVSHLVAGAAFAWALWYLHRHRGGVGGRALLVIILASVAYRLTVMPLQPATSHDVYRYLWEGIIQTHGYDPFFFAPGAMQIEPFTKTYAGLWQRVTFPDIATIYPPTAQLLFRANAVLFGGTLLGWKLILLCCDVLLALAVWAVLRRRGLAAVGLLGVLWCPLLVLEIYEAAHLDIVGVSLIVLAFAAMERKNAAVAGVLLGFAYNVKYLWPALAAILLFGVAWRQRQALRFAGACLATAIACWLPYHTGLTAAADTAHMFAANWTFNDVIFELLRSLDRMLLDRGVVLPAWGPMALVIVVLASLTAVLAWRTRGDVWADLWLVCGAGLLLSPVAYPWYFLWIVPGLAIAPPLWLIIWVVSVPGLHVVSWYVAAHGVWNPMPATWLAVGAVPAALLIVAWYRRLRMPASARSLTTQSNQLSSEAASGA